LNKARYPPRARGIKQYLGPDYICAQEIFSRSDAAIDVAFGREIDNHVRVVTEGGKHRRLVYDIAPDKLVPALINPVEIIQVAGIGKGVIVCYPAVRLLLEQEPYERRTNESRTS